jgi:outer membrane biosynthesis protein TonB
MSSKSGSNKSGKKVLRIGLIQNGKILEERLMRSAKAVRIGQDLNKNDLVVPASNLPKSFQLFEAKDGAYLLRFDSKMSGRISMGNGVYTLEELVREGKARKSEQGYILALNPRARGKVQIGEVTVLFQFVTPPPPVARPVLPASMRGGWFKGLDLYLVGIIALSALLQIGFVVWLQAQEWPEQLTSLDQKIPDRFVRIMKEPEPEEIEIPEDAEKPEESEGEGETEADPNESKQVKKQDPKPVEKPETEVEKDPKTPEEIAKAAAARKKRMMEEVRNSTILSQIGAVGEGSGGIVDTLEMGAGSTTMAEAFEGTQGVKTGVAGVEKSGLRSGGSSDADGTGSAAGIGDLGAIDGAKKAEEGVATGEKKEEKVEARLDIKDGGAVVGSGKLDASRISSVVRRGASAIQRCFERVLKKNPSAGGKLVITVTIGRAGRVTNVQANTSIGGGFKSCTETAVKGWRFPRPRGGDVMFNKTFVLQAAN